MSKKFKLIERIRYRSLTSILEDNKFYQISYETFRKRFITPNHKMFVNSLFNENEDYELLHALQTAEEFMKDNVIFVNIFTNKKIFLTQKEYFNRREYEAIFTMAGIKVDKIYLQGLIKIANGF